MQHQRDGCVTPRWLTDVPPHCISSRHLRLASGCAKRTHTCTRLTADGVVQQVDGGGTLLRLFTQTVSESASPIRVRCVLSPGSAPPPPFHRPSIHSASVVCSPGNAAQHYSFLLLVPLRSCLSHLSRSKRQHPTESNSRHSN